MNIKEKLKKAIIKKSIAKINNINDLELLIDFHLDLTAEEHTPKAGRPQGRKHSAATKRKMRKAHQKRRNKR